MNVHDYNHHRVADVISRRPPFFVGNRSLGEISSHKLVGGISMGVLSRSLTTQLIARYPLARLNCQIVVGAN